VVGWRGTSGRSGRIALPHARASLAHAERARTAALRASGIDAGELHVGTLFSISVGILPGALGIWHTRYPDMSVRLVEFRRSSDLIAAMEAGQADVAVGPTPEGWTGPSREIGAEKFVVTAAPGTVLPGSPPTVRIADLADHLWVHYTPCPTFSMRPVSGRASNPAWPCGPSRAPPR